jgi:superfamily II DNA/RNA helicase
MSVPQYWQSSEGQALLNEIVRKRVPEWTGGLKEAQADVIGKVLDGEKVLWVSATGEGKSAAFQIPIIVHEELRQNVELCPGFKGKEKPVGIVVTPTKGLASNIVRIN